LIKTIKSSITIFSYLNILAGAVKRAEFGQSLVTCTMIGCIGIVVAQGTLLPFLTK